MVKLTNQLFMTRFLPQYLLYPRVWCIAMFTACHFLCAPPIHGAGNPSPLSPVDQVIEEKFDWDKERNHWSYQPPVASDAPAVNHSDWPNRKLDFYILAKLEGAGGSPSPTGDFRRLIRRLNMDLTGLPPAVEELEALPDRYDPILYSERVERLLNSYAYGERMTSLWLNLARYAEDQAHKVGSNTSMFYPNAYLYRQWVIEAFNRDLAYDEFIRMQLAADLVPLDRNDDIRALGFLGLGPKYYNRGLLEVQADEWEDRVDTVTRSFLGLTVACARCHDHKYDAITIEDYYSLAGIFASTDMVNLHLKSDGSKVTDEERKSRKFEIHAVKEGKVRNLPVFKRGQVSDKGLETPRRFLRILSDDIPQPFNQGSGRLELAQSIATSTNPLTARVYVNRIWGIFMGEPLVSTPSNFGELGSHPTHPELLDDLAVRFIESGWSTKWLIREILYSATYRQSSKVTSGGELDDPENRLLGRMNRKRVSIEMWRDSAMAIAGMLDQKGGQSLELSDKSNFRRTVYSRISRLSLDKMLMQFDYPDANVHSAERNSTITPTQKLYAMNDPFFINLARNFAENLKASNNGGSVDQLVNHAFKQVYFREADKLELEASRTFLTNGTGEIEPDRLIQFCQSLLISNEMIYLD